MRVITLNANGIRASARKGFFPWMAKQNADFVCIQETKAQIHQLAKDVFCPDGYHCYYHDALKKGYSGVALFCREKPKRVQYGLGWSVADDEGRYVEAHYDGITIASIYLPSGTSGEARQTVKFEFLDYYLSYLRKMRRRKNEFIISGDWNIAHKKIDLKNWRGNQKNSGFLPEEREWMENLFTKEGLCDAFRTINQEPEQYTWWSNRGQAWDKNVGWRIDYQVTSPNLRDKVKKVEIYKKERFSDHAPLIIDYDL